MATAAAVNPAEARAGTNPGWLKWAIAAAACLGALLEVVDTSIVNVALTDMQSTLGATLSEIGWVVTSYAIANVIIIPLTAWLGDYFGKKRYFVFSLIAFTLASMLCGFATSLPMLIFARVLQGLGGGGLLAKAQAILFETFPKEEQGMAQALFGVGVIAGPAIGPTLGGYLTTNYNWRWIFFINLPVGIAAVLMAIAFLPPDVKKRTISSVVDWLGIGLLIVWVGSLQTMLEQGEENNWFESSKIRILAVTAVIGLGLFIWRELKARAPAVDLRVLRHRSLVAGSIVSAVLGLGLYGALFAVPIFAQTALHMTPLQTGMLLFPGAMASAFMMPVVGKLVSKFDPRLLIGVGGAINIGTMVVLSRISPYTSTHDLYWPLITRGIGTVMMFLPLSLATLGSLPRQDISAGSGFYNLTRQMGGSIGIAILTTLLAQREVFHKAILTENINLYNPVTVQRLQQYTAAFMQKGADYATAHERALAVLGGTVRLHASVMSFGDVFHFVAITFACTLPLLFLLGRGRGGAPADVH